MSLTVFSCPPRGILFWGVPPAGGFFMVGERPGGCRPALEHSVSFPFCSLRWAQRAAQPRRCLRQKQPRRSRDKHSDRVLRTKQGAVFGAALRFLQAPAAARRKNWLSARGTNSDRVLWQAHRSASCGRSSEVCLAQRSEFSSIILDAQEIQGTARGRSSPCGLFPRRGMSRSDRGTH